MSANDDKRLSTKSSAQTPHRPNRPHLSRTDLRPLCEELGIKEEELEPKPLEAFQAQGVPEDVQRLRFDRYEAKRKEKVRLLQQALRDRKPNTKSTGGERLSDFSRSWGKHQKGVSICEPSQPRSGSMECGLSPKYNGKSPFCKSRRHIVQDRA